jgi:hypothetical protein
MFIFSASPWTARLNNAVYCVWGFAQLKSRFSYHFDYSSKTVSLNPEFGYSNVKVSAIIYMLKFYANWAALHFNLYILCRNYDKDHLIECLDITKLKLSRIILIYSSVSCICYKVCLKRSRWIKLCHLIFLNHIMVDKHVIIIVIKLKTLKRIKRK